MDVLNLIRMMWDYSPGETAMLCMLTVVCSVGLALCIIGLLGG